MDSQPILLILILLLGLVAGAYCGYITASRSVTKQCNKYIMENYENETTKSIRYTRPVSSGINITIESIEQELNITY